MGLIMKTLLGIIFLVLIAFGILWLYLNLMGLTPIPAHLIADSGTVELKSGAVWNPVSDLDLSKGDIVRTGQNGRATIIFFESSFIKLFPNTEIEIKEWDKGGSKIILKQNSGSTWSQAVTKQKKFDLLSRITDYLGLDYYRIETLSAVMTAKGDSAVSFGVDLDENRLAVKQGTINLDIGTLNKDLSGSENGEEAIFSEVISLRQFSQDAFVQAGIKSQQENLIVMRERLKKKYQGFLAIVKDKSKLSDSEMDEKIGEYLRGE